MLVQYVHRRTIVRTGTYKHACALRTPPRTVHPVLRPEHPGTANKFLSDALSLLFLVGLVHLRHLMVAVRGLQGRIERNRQAALMMGRLLPEIDYALSQERMLSDPGA